MNATDIASDNNDADRTAAHEENERMAAEFGVPYPEPTRSLRCTLNGIHYELFAAIMSWSAPADDCLMCLRCNEDLDVIAPNMLHEVPLAMCACSSSYMTPVDPRDAALLELAHPVSEQEKRLGERFHRQIARLIKEDSNERTS